MKKNISGQFLYFDLTSAISGNAVTGATGISGRKAFDGGTLALLSGTIAEDGGGMYHANLFDGDTNGNNIGFLFSSSGCVPRVLSVVTAGGVSGVLFLGSGTNVNVWSGQLSGQLVTPASGQEWLASGSIVRETFASGILSGDIPRNVLRYDFTGFSGIVMSGVSGRCLMQAARKLTNKWDLATSGYLAVYQEDDATIAYRASITAASGADPISALDTV